MFVTLEGPEGAGKTSVLRLLGEQLERDGLRVLLTREPGDGTLGSRIREILLEGSNLDPRAELFLFLADRAQHVAEVVGPALAEGSTVLCDRYVDSTLAYQGYGRGLDHDTLRLWNDFATGGLMPQLTILLDIDPGLGLARIRRKDRLDSEPIDFHRKVRQGFLQEARRDPGRWLVLDASEDLKKVTEAAYVAVVERQATHI